MFVLQFVVITTVFAQTSVSPYNITFVHNPGQGNSVLNSDGLQPVHELKYTYYMLPGETRELELPVRSVSYSVKGYYRWFDLDSDSISTAVTNLVFFTDTTISKFVKPQVTNYGVFIYQRTPKPEPPAILYNAKITFSGTPVTIACEVSNYADFYITTKNSLLDTVVEPTLSYRVIFDIRPASEIAALINDTTPYEYYDLIAPADSTMLLATNMKSSGQTSCYYVGNSPRKVSSPKMYRSTTGLTGTYSVYNASVEANRQYNVVAPDSGNVYYYELRDVSTSTHYIIARWKVTGLPISSIGPTTSEIISDSHLNTLYHLAAKQDFDVSSEFLDSTYYKKTSTYLTSRIPLGWDECSYGFTYPPGSGSAGSSKQRGPEFAGWGEYIIVQGIPQGASWIRKCEDHNNPGTGCFMYVDANEAPGLIANLVFNGNFCPGTDVYVSAWINSLASNNAPNLNFTLIGVDDYGKETPLQSYTTGKNNFVKNAVGVWHQVFFKVMLDNQHFNKYRVRIENNNSTSSGNDFAIDDIRIYTSKTSVYSVEGFSACGIKTQQELIDAENGLSESLALIRVDYKSDAFIPDSAGNVDVYYRWIAGSNPKGGENDSVLNINYLTDKSVDNTKAPYGICVLPKFLEWDSIPDSLKCNNISDFLLRNNKPIIDGEIFFMQEPVIRASVTEIVPVLYIAHKNSVFKKFSNYTCLVSSNDDFNTICNGYYSIKTQNCQQLLINGTPQELVNLRFKTLSVERDYELSTRVYYNDFKNNGIVASATPYCDWICGVDDRFIEASLTRAFVNFRSEYPDATSLDQPVKGSFRQATKDSLMMYADKVQLYKRSITTNLPGDGTTVQYIVYPIMGSCDDSTIQVCPNPLRVRLRSDVRFSLGKRDYESMPEDIQGAPAVIRIAESRVNMPDNQFSMMINYVQGDPVVDGKMYLYRTNDTTAQKLLGTHTYNFTPNVAVNNTHTYTRVANELTMLPGYEYKFSARYEDTPFDTAYGCFIVKVVPDIVLYKPTAENSNWHNDIFWKDKDGKNAFIPVVGTKVILPVGNTILEDYDITSFEENPEVTYHLNYNYGIGANTCGSIYFPIGAKMSGQQYLVYDSAYVDVPVSKGAYSLMGLPLQTVYSGDLFIPKVGNKKNNDFVFNPEKCDSRLANKINIKRYNSTTTFWFYSHGEKIDSVSTALAGWGNPSNSLSDKFVNTALAVMAIDTAVQDFIQLPKTDSVYYFYAIRKATGEEYQVPEKYGKADIIHDASCYKLLYQGDTANLETTITYTNVIADSWFLVTNPFMGNLSMQAFMDANTEVIDGFYYTYEDGMTTAVPVTAETVVAPFAAFFIHTKTAAQSVNIKYNPETMVVNTAAVTPMPANAKDNTQINGAHTLRILAEKGSARSVATVTEDVYGSNDYDPQEDADLLMFNDNLTPFAVYTRIGNTPVMVNRVRTIDMIPLSVSVLDTAIGNIELSFFGTENFTRPVYLYDALTDINTEIHSGMKIDFDGSEPDAVRYYLNINRSGIITAHEETNNDAAITVYGNNNVIYCKSNNDIISVSVYDIAGHLINEQHNIFNNSFQIQLPLGVYVVEVRTIYEVLNSKVFLR